MKQTYNDSNNPFAVLSPTNDDNFDTDDNDDDIETVYDETVQETNTNIEDKVNKKQNTTKKVSRKISEKKIAHNESYDESVKGLKESKLPNDNEEQRHNDTNISQKGSNTDTQLSACKKKQ